MALRIVKWIAIGIAGLVALIGLILLGLDTSPGKRFIADRLAGFETASGLNFRVGRIEGSIYGAMRLRDVEVRDSQGAFLTAPLVILDWRPFAYARSKIDVRLLSTELVTLSRAPVLKATPSDPNAPLLPDIDLTLAKLHVGRLIVAPPVTGSRHIVSLDGSAEIADGRARILADAGALRAAGLAGGDRARVRLDARPDRNLLDIDMSLNAPAGGLLDSYAKIGKPLALSVGGRGDWANWRGQARGVLGGQPLALLDITGRSGTFRTVGTFQPGLILSGPAARLVEPAVRIDATTAFDKRRVDTRLKLDSRAFTAEANGLIDLGASRFGNLRLAAQLLTPGAIAPNLRGHDVRLTATLDGAFATPTIDYRLSAAALGIDTLSIDGLVAAGKATIDADRIRLPVHATARRVTGLNAAAGGLLTNIRIDGDLAYQDGKLASDNLRLRSDRIDATALLLADIAKGTYTGALKGRINDYQVDGLGRISLVTDARLAPGANNGFGIAGKVRIVTRRLDNASLRDQLGGNALITVDVGYDLAGGAKIRNLRLTAPRFRITSGGGSYRPNGRIAFNASGRSSAYGPFALTVSGTVARPVARLRAGSPGLGVGLAGVEATLEGTSAGYRIRARGQSDYGPFAADLLVRAGRGPLAVEIASADFAGIRFAGGITQTAAGPFAGTLTLAGSGLNGTIRLAAAGAVQQADVDVRASAARLPGPTPVTIGQGTLRATVLLTSDAPSITGRFALFDVRRGTAAIARTQGRIDYRNGQGNVALVASGRTGAPFEVALQATLTPARVVANLRGTVNRVPLRLARPAVASKVGANWTLAPATILLPQGQVDVSGSFGQATSLRAALRNLDLALVQAFVPGLGLGGKANGTIDYAARGAVPDLRARIDIANFTRTASLTVSDPVDIALLGTLNGNGGEARALVRRGGATVGRMLARLAPLGAGAGLSERLFKAPLSGGIRYSGPAEVVWTLAGIPRQELSGPLAIGADFGGRLEQPTVSGVVRATALRYENETYGTVLSNIAIDGRFTQAQFQLSRLTARAGSGSLSASGTVGLNASGGFPIDLKATLDRAQLARSDALGATVSGSLGVTHGRGGGLISGDLTLPEARYQIIRQDAAAVSELTGVRRKGVQPVSATAAAGPASSNWKLDIRLRAANRIFVNGMGLEAEWRTDMRVGGTASAPTVVGRLDVVRGTYSFNGRRFELDRGRVTFQGAAVTNPALDISATTSVEGTSISINIGGYAQNPQISFTSTPALPQDEVLSRLLFGSSITSLSPTQAIQLAAALNGLRGSGGGLNPLGKLRSVAGVDRLRVLGADQNAGRGTALAAGKYISNNVYVEIVTDARGFTATQLEVSLSRALSVLSQAGSFGGSNVTVRYRKDY